jgi:hypothetical protein
MRYLTLSNSKILKGFQKGFITYGLHFAPSTLSGRNVCPNASPGCAAACLNTAGRGMMNMVQEARINKTNKFYDNKFEFVLQLVKDIQAGIRFATRKQMNVCFRLNLTSDIRWEKYGIMQEFPKQQFYDYTKSKQRMKDFLGRGLGYNSQMPHNYHLTFSRSTALLVCRKWNSYLHLWGRYGIYRNAFRLQIRPNQRNFSNISKKRKK